MLLAAHELTLYGSLQEILGTLKGLLALIACFTVIGLFAQAFQNYKNGEYDGD